MQARTTQDLELEPPTADRPGNEGRASVKALVRQWGPYVLTALVVPGGIVIVLLMLWRARG